MYIRRIEYIAVAVLFVVLGVAAAVITALSLDTGISDPDRKTLKTADDIVVRAGSLTSISDDEVRIAKARVEDGLISCGDYVISVMTSPEYLLNGISDEQFANDLCTVIYGESKHLSPTQLFARAGYGNADAETALVVGVESVNADRLVRRVASVPPAGLPAISACDAGICHGPLAVGHGAASQGDAVGRQRNIRRFFHLNLEGGTAILLDTEGDRSVVNPYAVP